MFFSRHRILYSFSDFFSFFKGSQKSKGNFQEVLQDRYQLNCELLPELRYGLYLWLEFNNLKGKTVAVSKYSYHVMIKILVEFGCRLHVLESDGEGNDLVENPENYDAIFLSLLYSHKKNYAFEKQLDLYKRPVFIDSAHVMALNRLSHRLNFTTSFSFGVGKEIPLGKGGVVFSSNHKWMSFCKSKVEKLQTQTYLSSLYLNMKNLLLGKLTGGLFFQIITFPVLFLIDLFNFKKLDAVLSESNQDFKLLDRLELTKMVHPAFWNVGIFKMANLDQARKVKEENLQTFCQILSQKGKDLKMYPTDISFINYLMISSPTNSANFRKQLLKKGIDSKPNDMGLSNEIIDRKSNVDHKSLLVEIPFDSVMTKKDVTKMASRMIDVL